MKTELIKKIKRIVGKDLIQLFYRSLFFLSDENYVKLIYRLRMGRRLNLSEPEAFTEKLQWLKKHLSSVAWDEIHIVPYGTNKATSCGVNNSNFILFDDEEQNRKTWEKFGGFSYPPTEITMTLSMLNQRLR